MQPSVTAPHPCAELSLYVARRRQLVELLKHERQHRTAAQSDSIRDEIAEHVTHLEQLPYHWAL